MPKISDQELERLAEGYPPEEFEPTIMSMAKEIQGYRRLARAAREDGDSITAALDRIRVTYPMSVRRIGEIVEAFRAIEAA